jgi:hypothetical protein
MRLFSSLLTLVFPVLPLLAGGADGASLDYRLKVRLRDAPAMVESSFRVVAMPPLATRGRVQRPRMGSWRIEPLGPGTAPSPALLARVLRLCYFSGPGVETVPLATGMKFAGRWCRLWQVQTPREVGAYAYLAEVAPGLLALAYLSASLPEGDIRSVEIHLSGLSLGRRAAPAEEGAALLKTLQHWAGQPGSLDGGPSGRLEKELVP